MDMNQTRTFELFLQQARGVIEAGLPRVSAGALLLVDTRHASQAPGVLRHCRVVAAKLIAPSCQGALRWRQANHRVSTDGAQSTVWKR